MYYFFFHLGPQGTEVISNLSHLAEISGRLHHLNVFPNFVDAVSTIGKD